MTHTIDAWVDPTTVTSDPNSHTIISKTDNALVKVQPKDNTPPPGFVAAFDGKDLTGWKGLLKPKLDNPFNRAKLTPDELAAAQKEADDNMRAHWSVQDGTLVFDGHGRNLCTAKDYARR